MCVEMVPIPGDLIEFAQRLFGPSVDQVGLVLGDWVRLWRAKNLLSIKERMDRILQEKGFDPAAGRHLTLSVGLPLLEKASYQDDSFLQERWAHLIASSLCSDDQEESNFNLDITCIEALHQFSRLDCEVLEFIVENGVVNMEEEGGIVVKRLEPDAVHEALPHAAVHLSLEKLVSLGCVRRDPKLPLKPGGMALEEIIGPTTIGINLYISASGKNPGWFRS